MKYIHLIRHAKSSWKNLQLHDHDRPLNKRGINSCKIMASELIRAGCQFEHTYVSSALRAQQTAELLFRYTQTTHPWTTKRKLYSFEGLDLLAFLQTLNTQLNQVSIISHNPALIDICNYLTGEAIEHLPTCGYFQVQLLQPHWSRLSRSSARLTKVLYPKLFIA